MVSNLMGVRELLAIYFVVLDTFLIIALEQAACCGLFVSR